MEERLTAHSVNIMFRNTWFQCIAGRIGKYIRIVKAEVRFSVESHFSTTGKTAAGTHS